MAVVLKSSIAAQQRVNSTRLPFGFSLHTSIQRSETAPSVCNNLQKLTSIRQPQLTTWERLGGRLKHVVRSNRSCSGPPLYCRTTASLFVASAASSASLHSYTSAGSCCCGRSWSSKSDSNGQASKVCYCCKAQTGVAASDVPTSTTGDGNYMGCRCSSLQTGALPQPNRMAPLTIQGHTGDLRDVTQRCSIQVAPRSRHRAERLTEGTFGSSAPSSRPC